MAVLTIQDLIAQKATIEEKRGKKYEIETSLGTILVRMPTTADVAESLSGKTGLEINSAIIYSCCVSPDLHSEELQKAYGAFSPEDIVQKIFSAGEISRIGDALFELANYSGKKIIPKLYEEVTKK